jgi:DNA-binding protein H-NS
MDALTVRKRAGCINFSGFLVKELYPIASFSSYKAGSSFQRIRPQMAKAVQKRGRKTATQKTRRKTAAQRVPSDKLRVLVNNLSAPELDQLIKFANERKSEEVASAKASFFAEVKSKAASLGVSLAELASLGAKAVGIRKDSGRASPAAKYRNPKTGETWAGRGRPAKWLTDLEAKGRKREEFAV